MENLTREQIKKAVTEAFEMLQDAPLQGSDYIKFYAYEDGTIDPVILGQNSHLQGGEQIGRIEYTHPQYDGSEKAMEERGLEVTDESLKAWDWENFTVGEDFSNAVEHITDEILQNIEDIQNEQNYQDSLMPE